MFETKKHIKHMIPLPTNPNVIVLVDDNNNVVGVSTNVALDLKVEVLRSQTVYDNRAKGNPFVTGMTETANG
jgi:hypothetical protein